MLEEQAQVVATTPQLVVETIRQSACAGCRASKGCGQKLLSDIGQGARFQVQVRNPRGLALQCGDRVILGLEETSLLSASLLVYLLPLGVMVVLALFAQLQGLSEPWVAGAGLSGLIIGLGIVRAVGPTGDSGCKYQPEVLRKSS